MEKRTLFCKCGAMHVGPSDDSDKWLQEHDNDSPFHGLVPRKTWGIIIAEERDSMDRMMNGR
jgi:hypothetical protein